MYIESLELLSWRNFNLLRLMLLPGINLITGINGSGKTNCLEALSFASIGSSFRGASYSDCLLNTAKDFSIKVTFISSDIQNKLSISGNHEKRIVQYNNERLASSWSGIIPSVIIVPNDQEIVFGSASVRRRFLDNCLKCIDPLYSHHIINFKRSLMQRNILLKKHDKKGLNIWNVQYIKSASYITLKRQLLIDVFSNNKSIYNSIPSKQASSFDVIYKPTIKSLVTRELKDIETAFSESIEKNYELEARYGFSLYGPHRDDFDIIVNGKSAKSYLSNGEAYLIIIILNALYKNLLINNHINPVILIDELGHVLDQTAMRVMYDFLQGSQVVCTSSHANVSIINDLSVNIIELVRDGKNII